MSVPHIGASGCGFWPTARTTGLDGGSNSRKAAKARGMWPTATADDASNVTRDSGQFQSLTRNVMASARGEAKWPTPQTVDGKKTARPLRKKQDRQTRNETPGSYRGDLADHVARGGATPQTWGTPTSRDHKDTGENTNYQRQADRSLLSGQVGVEKSTPGSLSPLWVEWLQGFPPEWTDCAASVTPSVLTRWRLRSRCWLRLLGYEVAE